MRERLLPPSPPQAEQQGPSGGAAEDKGAGKERASLLDLDGGKAGLLVSVAVAVAAATSMACALFQVRERMGRTELREDRAKQGPWIGGGREGRIQPCCHGVMMDAEDRFNPCHGTRLYVLWLPLMLHIIYICMYI